MSETEDKKILKINDQEEEGEGERFWANVEEKEKKRNWNE